MRYFEEPGNCIAYMVRMRWPSGDVKCPICGSGEVVWMSHRQLFQCKARHPKRQFSVKVGTVMENSPIPLGKWLLVTWMLMNCRNGVSSHEIGRTIGVTQKSAWFMLHRLRFAMHEDGEPLAGDVEADETYVGGKSQNMHKRHRQRRIRRPGVHDKTPVLGILQRGGRVRAMVVKGHKRQVLQGEIRKHVAPGSNVYTDNLHSYWGLSADYVHGIVDHAYDFVRGNVHTNGLENFWSLLKRALKGTYISVRPEHLMAYVQEQVFRYNHRRQFTEEMRFASVVGGMTGKRLTYKQLIGVTV
jgi:transposase-like protein